MPRPANASTAPADRRSPGLPAPRAGLAGAAGPDAAGDAETVAQMRRALGQQLAAMRNRAGLSQWDLAPLTGYSRSTLSDAELGRHRLRREFWLRCDGLLKADGRLVAAYDRIETAAAVISQRARSTAQLAREQHASGRLQAVAPAGRPPELGGDNRPDPPREQAREQGGSLLAMEACPHCRRPIAVLVVPGS
jgi:Helix-turn-helix domain